MKVVKLSHPNYEYDVHSLVKAFYAEDQVTVITPETKPEKLAELEPQVSLEIELGDTGAKIRVGEEIFLWEAASEAIADGYKNGLKRFLYRTLSKVTGQKLPWGNLTGIRPTKIAYGMLDEGRSGDDVWAETFTEQPAPLTAEEKKEYLSHVTGVCLGSDAFFPFGDNIERARRSGVTAIVQPGGSIRDQQVIDTCNKYGIAMAFCGIRLFHH